MSSNPFYVNVTDYTCDLYKQCCCPPISPDIEIAGIGVSVKKNLFVRGSLSEKLLADCLR